MPTDIEVLHQMIIEEAKVELQDYYDKPKVILTEPQCSNSSVTIFNLPDEIIVINLDSYWSIENMFTHENGQCRRADFVIIANDYQGVIIFIEIKKKKDQAKNIIQQLTGAQCFISFCQKVGQAQAFWNTENFLEGYLHRFVSIGNVSISKKPTRIRPSNGVHDSPEKMLKLSSPHHLTLKKLVGREGH